VIGIIVVVAQVGDSGRTRLWLGIGYAIVIGHLYGQRWGNWSSLSGMAVVKPGFKLVALGRIKIMEMTDLDQVQTDTHIELRLLYME